MTITVGAFEAKTKLSELLDRVERGEEVLITRHGKPVAKVSGLKPDRETDEIDLARLRRISDRFVEHFGRPFLSTDHGELLYDEDGLPK